MNMDSFEVVRLIENKLEIDEYLDKYVDKIQLI